MPGTTKGWVGASTRKRAQYRARAGASSRSAQLTIMRGGPRAGLGRSMVSAREVKSFDQVVAQSNLVALVNVVGAEPASFAGLTEINDVQQGAAFYQRIGSKIVIKSIQVGVTINCSANTPQVGGRLMLVYDRQPNGAFPASADLLQDNAAGQTFSSGLNMQNRSRFSIIRDIFFNLDAAQSLVHTMHFYVKGRWETEFKASSATIADIATGAIYLVLFRGTQVGGGNVTNYDAVTRIRFYD